MPSTRRENIETVLIDFFGALRRGDVAAASALLDPDVAWQGLREDLVCVRIDDYRRRSEALAAAGITGDVGWL